MRRLTAFLDGIRNFRASVVWQLLRRQKSWLWALIVLAFATMVVTLVTASTARAIVDDAIIEQSQPLGPLINRLVVLVVLAFVIGLAQRQVSSRLGFQVEYELRIWIYERLLGADPRRLDGVATGQVVTRAMTDLLFLEAITRLVPTVGVILVTLLGIGGYLFVQSPLMFFLATAAIPLNGYLALRLRNRLWGLSWMTLNQRAQVTTAVDEGVRGIRVVKALGREDHVAERVRIAAARAYGVAMSRVRLLARYDLLLQSFPLLLNVVVLLVGGWLVVNDRLTIGTLLLVVRYGRVFTRFAGSFDEIIGGYQFARSGADRIFELIAFAKPGRRPKTVERLPEPSAGLVLDGVGVVLGHRAVFSNLDLQVAPGELVVLTGAPASGKSVVASLAMGAIRPALGSVMLDGVDVRRLDRSELRGAVRVLNEQPFLFGRTVRANLEFGALAAGGYGKRRLNDDALRAALAVAGAEGIVDELPDGLDTVLGDRGLTLSGGQRQRLALARALVSPPRVLVLDDALSAVEPTLELEILRRMREFAPSMAVLHITRRPGAEALADRVVTLPDAVDPASPLARAAAAAAERMEVAAAAAAAGAAPADGVVASTAGASLTSSPFAGRLAAVAGELPVTFEEPHIQDEEQATADERPPTIGNVLRPFRRRILLVCGILVAMTSVKLVPEALQGIAVDALEARRISTVNLVAFTLAGLAVFVALTSYLFKILQKQVDEGVLYLLRRRVFHRLTRLGIDFYDRELPGQVSARVVHDLDRVSNFVDEALYKLVVDVTLMVGAVVAIVIWDPSMLFLVGGFASALVLVSVVQLPFAQRAYVLSRRRVGGVTARMQEDFAGRYVITEFGAQQGAREGFADSALALRSARRFGAVVENGYGELVQLICELAQAAITARAGYMVLRGEISTGDLIVFQGYLAVALVPIRDVTRQLHRFLQARVSFRKLAEPFEAPVLPEEAPDARPCPPLRGALELRNVTFRYPGLAREVLHDVSLRIEPGQFVAVVGPTGAGKSSIAKLLGRIYDPDQGAVLVDGLDVRSLDLTGYRRRVGVVPQEAFCFAGTVASNVAFGRPSADHAEIEAALRAVGAWEELSRIPGGLDAEVEEEGRNLTAAQRQLVALARTWFLAPDVLVFDEATNGLPDEVEARVIDAVVGLGCTTVLVTHRLAVTDRVDRVLVVQDGCIVEDGSQSELLGSGGTFAGLWASDPQAARGNGAARVRSGRAPKPPRSRRRHSTAPVAPPGGRR